MSGTLRKTMVYLGLAEEDGRYEHDYDDYDDPSLEVESDRLPASVTALPKRPVAQVVRDVHGGSLNRITTIHPRTYNEAKNIGEWFRGQVPVILNLSNMDDADAKRLVDFAAGLVFGLHGTIERVTAKVFLLSPSHVEIAADEPEAAPVAAAGFFNQS